MKKAYFLAVQEQWDRPRSGKRAGDWTLYQYSTVDELRTAASKFKAWNDEAEQPVNYKMLVFDEDIPLDEIERRAFQ